MCGKKSFFQCQHEKLLASSWHACYIMEEEKSEPDWMIAQVVPDLFRLLSTHCMLEEEFMIFARYPDYFWHEKEHKEILGYWRRCGKKDLTRQEKRQLIQESSHKLSQHIASTDIHLRQYAAKYHFPDEISLLKMQGIRFPFSGLFPKKKEEKKR